jgi:hypothetical protein
MSRSRGGGVLESESLLHVLLNGPERFVYKRVESAFSARGVGVCRCLGCVFVCGRTFLTRPCSARDAGKQSAKPVVNFHSQYMVWDITAHEGRANLCRFGISGTHSLQVTKILLASSCTCVHCVYFFPPTQTQPIDRTRLLAGVYVKTA